MTDFKHPSPRVAGVDPGKQGAVVALDGWDAACAGVAVAEADYCGAGEEYRLQDIARLLRELSPDLVVVERQHAMPKQGRSSCVTIGYGWGIWEMAAAALGLRWVRVSAVTWQRDVLRGFAGATTKAKAMAAAAALAPGVNLIPPGKRSRHSGVADAACIAVHGLRWFGRLAEGEERE